MWYIALLASCFVLTSAVLDRKKDSSVAQQTDGCRAIEIYTSRTGSLASPNFPGRYSKLLHCQYLINPSIDVNSVLKLEAVSFDLEGGYDVLEVRDSGPHGNYYGLFSGTVIPVFYAKAFWLRFTSDFSNSRKGFSLKWSVVSEGVRLVNGSLGLEGRVELFWAGKWGTICDDSWEPEEAYVTCKMLGFKDLSARHFTRGQFGAGIDPILLDNTACKRHMTTLSQCRVDAWGAHNCNHGEDSGVRCTEAWNKLKRIIGERSNFPKGCGGWFSNSTGTILSPLYPQLYPNYANCHYTITTPKNRNTIMKLTFSVFDLQDGVDFLEIREDGPKGPFLGRFAGNHLPPTIYAKNIWLSFSSDVSIGRRGFVAEWNSVLKGVRLRNGTRYNEGRVEVYKNDVWGTICDDSFDKSEVTVICRMMGFIGSDGEVLAAGSYGHGLGSILLDDLACSGEEDDIQDCVHRSGHDCSHAEDAAVRCSRETPLGVDSSENNTDIKYDLSLSEAVSVSCDSLQMTIVVKLDDLSDEYSGLVDGSMYLTLGTDTCLGQRNNNSIVINVDITDCGMLASDSYRYIIYRNRLMSHENSSTSGNSSIFSGNSVAIPVQCSLAKDVTLTAAMNAYRNTRNRGGKVIKGYGNFSTELNFYKDPSYSHPIIDFPIYVEVGQEMYVQTGILTKSDWLKVVLHKCMAMSSLNSTDSDIIILIHNRCAVDASTVISSSPSINLARFHFKTFQFLRQKEQVYIKCTLLVCNVNDTSNRCRTGCSSDSRYKRFAEEDPNLVEVVQGPLMFQPYIVKDIKRPTLNIGIIIAGVAVSFFLAITIVLLTISRKKKVMWFANQLYEDTGNEIPMKELEHEHR